MTSALHVYLLLDVSASMHGAALEALKQGVHLLGGVLSSHTEKRPIRLSAITYESVARTLIPLSEIGSGVELPTLEVGGSSGLGGALRHLSDQLLRPDHRPTLVYIFTDGDPTDEWQAALEAVRPRVDKIVAFGCGWKINEITLQSITAEAYSLDEVSADAIFATMRKLI